MSCTLYYNIGVTSFRHCNFEAPQMNAVIYRRTSNVRLRFEIHFDTCHFDATTCRHVSISAQSKNIQNKNKVGIKYEMYNTKYNLSS